MSRHLELLACYVSLLVLAVVEGPAESIYEPYGITTLAGTRIYGSVDGPRTAAKFARPCGVVTDGAGNAYVVEAGDRSIRKVTPAGVVTTLPGMVGSYVSPGGTAYFRRGVAMDQAGNLYVGDTYSNLIMKVTVAGVVTILAGRPGLDEHGNPLSLGSKDGTGSEAQFKWPASLAMDATGVLYAADTGNSTIRKITTAGVVTTLAGLAGVNGSADGVGNNARFHIPQGVAVDATGMIYVADTWNNSIRKVTPSGVVTTLAGVPGGGYLDGAGSQARFNAPMGVAVDGLGNVYVADTGNWTLRKVTPAGAVTTLAGLAGNYGSMDGLGSDARFGTYLNARPTGPENVAVDAAGNVFVADTWNNTIRKGFPELAVGPLQLAGPTAGVGGGPFVFQVTASSWQTLVIEASTDLLHWLPISTNTFAGTLIFTDPQTAAHARRFYRAHSQ